MLTGKTRYRINWLKKLILQVQFEGKKMENAGATVDVYDTTWWRDAKIEDLTLEEEE